jgi:hypothetical protein
MIDAERNGRRDLECFSVRMVNEDEDSGGGEEIVWVMLALSAFILWESP